MSAGGIVLAAGLRGPWLVLLVFGGLGLCAAAQELQELEGKAAALEDLQNCSELCSEALEACEENGDCDRYNLQVAQQGRSLVNAEAEALIDWALSEEDREAYDKLAAGASLLKTAGTEA